jgi:hypothetical protein
MKKSYLSTHTLRLSILGATLGLSLGSQAADVFQTESMGVNHNWTEAVYWSNAETPSAGNDYFNANDDNGIDQYRWGTRTPTGSANYIFPGDSLTFTNGGYLNIKGTGTHTFSNMTVWCSETIPGELENGGASGATIAGNLNWKGTGTAKLDAQGSNRMTTIAALMTVDAGIDTVSVLMEQSPPGSTGYILSGFNLTNPTNTFSGLWDVQQGLLKGSGFGTGSFKVGAFGTLDFDADYTNPSADLTIATGGGLLLDQFITVDTATINFKALSAKTWTAAELIADPTIGSAIDPLSTGSLTVLTGPPPVPTETIYQTATMAPGIDWNNAGYWDNAATPSSDYFYANDTAGWITQTPISSSTFNGYSLAIQNGASLNLQGAATYAVSTLELEAGSAITRSSTGAALLSGVLDLTGTGEVTFDAQSTNSMTTIASSLVLTNGSVSTIVIDMTDGSVTNTEDAQLSGFIFPVKSDFSGLWQVNGGLLKGIGFGSGSFLVTDFGRLDFDQPYYNLGADLSIEASVVDPSQGGTMVLDQTVNVGTATIWGESLAPGLYTGAELKTNAIYGAAFSGALTLDTSILAVGVPAPINQVANATPSSL